MATTSIGTLKAMLVLDTSKWTGGFAAASKATGSGAASIGGKASKVADSLSKTAKGAAEFNKFAAPIASRFGPIVSVATNIGAKLAALGPLGIAAGASLIGVGVASYGAYKSMQFLISGLASIDKQFARPERVRQRLAAAAQTVKSLGLGLSQKDVNASLRAYDAVQKVSAALTALHQNVAATFAPAIETVMNVLVEGIGSTVKAIRGVRKAIEAVMPERLRTFLKGASSAASAFNSVSRGRGVTDLEPAANGPKTQVAAERGSTAAVQAIAAAGGNPLSGLHDDLMKLLVELKQIKGNTGRGPTASVGLASI